MKKTICFIIGILYSLSLFSQEPNCYKKIDFEDFVKNRTSDSYNYIKTIYKKLYYKSTEENEKDRKYDILLICNGRKNIELIGIDNCDEFNIEIKKVFELANDKFLIDDNQKYITRIPIKIDFEPQEEFKWKTNSSEIHLFSYSIIKHNVTTSCSFEIKGKKHNCKKNKK